MDIRPATPADAGAIASLTRELGYAADAPAIDARLQHLCRTADDTVLVAADEGVIGGWIQAHASCALESGFRIEIVGLVVSERFRRRGVGRDLVAAAEAWAAARQVEVVTVRSNVQRAESHAFYPALGYERTKTQAVYRKRMTPRGTRA